MSRNIISKKYETFIVSVMLFVFFIGFFMGWNYADTTLTNTEINIEKARLDLNSFSQSLIFIEKLNNTLCNQKQIKLMNEKLSIIATQLDSLEKEKVSKDSYYELLKEKYNINQVLFYTFYNEYSKKCENSANMLLFFFNTSNEEKSNLQGLELDKLVEKYDIIVLPMDYGYSENLDYFYEFYNSDALPSLIIDYTNIYSGFTSFEQIEEDIFLK
jgi:hypothetical protein